MRAHVQLQEKETRAISKNREEAEEEEEEEAEEAFSSWLSLGRPHLLYRVTPVRQNHGRPSYPTFPSTRGSPFLYFFWMVWNLPIHFRYLFQFQPDDDLSTSLSRIGLCYFELQILSLGTAVGTTFPFVPEDVLALENRRNAEWTESKSGHPGPCQNCSQRPPAEKTEEDLC